MIQSNAKNTSSTKRIKLVTKAEDKDKQFEKGCDITHLSLGKHFSVLELRTEETGRRGEHGRVFQRRWWVMENE